MSLTAAEVIRRLDLVPMHVEGGFFRETYRSDRSLPAEALPAVYGAPRSLGTAIYYLLSPETFSAMHRVHGDEIFHFYAGAPTEMLRLYPDGRGNVVTLGSRIEDGHEPQVVVPGGVWQGMRLIEGGRFALMGTTMAPGFDPLDFTLGDRETLSRAYPGFADRVRDLT